MSSLNKQLLTMAGYVEQAIDTATKAWRLRSDAKIQEVYSIEQKVNQAHIEVDDACVKLLALQQPMAADLRIIVSTIKINSDLERMTDLAVNIANNCEYFIKEQSVFDLTDLNAMADEVRVMVKEVLNSFVRMDQESARQVLRRDDEVDAFKRKIVTDAIAKMKTAPEAIVPGLSLILMAKNLERIGDHATNVAEDIIFMASGRDIRHSGAPRGGK